MNGKRLFLLYAFPCAEQRLYRGEITEEEYQRLQDMISGEPIDSKLLQKCFPQAWKDYHSFFDLMDTKNVRRFWLEMHNKMVDSGRGEFARYSEKEREICKVRIGKVVAFEGEIVNVDIDGKIQKVVNAYGLKLKPGDTVSIHYRIVIESLNDSLFDQ